MKTTNKKTYLLDFTRNELCTYFDSIGEKAYRGRQVYNWIYRKYASSFSEMTDLPVELQKKSAQLADLGRLKLKQELISAESGTRKFLFELDDGNFIETVFMYEDNRRTICISSQAGCALNCTFCATGLMGLKRSLSSGEIVDQLLNVIRLSGEKPTNVVFMGMGEPFHNYDNVIKAANIINDDNGLAIGARHITVSTVGLVDKMKRYYKEKHKFKLAVSLNAGTEETRRSLIPVSKKYPIKDIADVIRSNHKRKSRPVTFEYVLMKGINDSDNEIRSLISIVRGLPAKINLIPYNQANTKYSMPEEQHVNSIFRRLRDAGIQVNVRWSKGTDIQAACGQLYAQEIG